MAKRDRVGSFVWPLPMDKTKGKSGPVSVAKLSPQKRHGRVVGHAVDRGPRGNERGNGRLSPNGPTRENSFRSTGPRRDPRPVVGWLNRSAGGLCAVEQFQPFRGTADLSPSEASGAASSPGFSRVPVFCEPAAEGDAAEDTGIGASGHGEPLRSGTSIVLHVFKFSLHDDHPAGLIRRAVHPARTRAFAFIITKRLHKK